MGFKSEYKRMMNTNIWQLTIFEFILMFITIPIWCVWYQIDIDYFSMKNSQTESKEKK